MHHEASGTVWIYFNGRAFTPKLRRHECGVDTWSNDAMQCGFEAIEVICGDA